MSKFHFILGAADPAAEAARQAALEREAELTAAAVALGWAPPVAS